VAGLPRGTGTADMRRWPKLDPNHTTAK
jgi:hypothetical protein